MGERIRLPANIGMALKALRLDRGLRQRELAAQMGVSQSEISQRENRADIHLMRLREHIHALGGDIVVTLKFGAREYSLRLTDPRTVSE